MLTLVQTHAELGEIMIKAFVLRRLELLAAGIGDVVLIGSIYLADTLRIKEFLVWNGYPYSYIDLERDHDIENMLDNFHITCSELPVLIYRGKIILRNPSN
jgi:thioredoxin reductase (NADPH)